YVRLLPGFQMREPSDALRIVRYGDPVNRYGRRHRECHQEQKGKPFTARDRSLASRRCDGAVGCGTLLANFHRQWCPWSSVRVSLVKRLRTPLCASPAQLPAPLSPTGLILNNTTLLRSCSSSSQGNDGSLSSTSTGRPIVGKSLRWTITQLTLPF